MFFEYINHVHIAYSCTYKNMHNVHIDTPYISAGRRQFLFHRPSYVADHLSRKLPATFGGKQCFKAKYSTCDRWLHTKRVLCLPHTLQHAVQHTAACTVTHPATQCNTLLHSATHYEIYKYLACNCPCHMTRAMRAQLALEHTVAAHCSTHQNTLQYTSIQLGIAGAKRQGLCVCNTHCNAHCNTHCNTLQHTLQHTLQLTLQHNTRRIVCELYLHVCARWFVCVCAYTPAMTQTE